MEGGLHYLIQVGTACPKFGIKQIKFEEVNQARAQAWRKNFPL
jgi:hypothetical protein